MEEWKKEKKEKKKRKWDRENYTMEKVEKKGKLENTCVATETTETFPV